MINQVTTTNEAWVLKYCTSESMPFCRKWLVTAPSDVDLSKPVCRRRVVGFVALSAIVASAGTVSWR